MLVDEQTPGHNIEVEDLASQAIKFIRKQDKELIRKFADIAKHPPQRYPASVFMAGSPGAGKTEFSKSLIGILGGEAVRIDPDEVRGFLPQYTGSNASLFQNAVTIGVDTLYYSALKNNQNFILDGTMASLDIARKNISKCLASRVTADIFYIYQNPIIAWQFTKDREKLEGRNITKQTFIKALYASRENVNIIKREYGERVKLHFIEKDFKHDISTYKISVQSVDNYLKMSYTLEDLERELYEE